MMKNKKQEYELDKKKAVISVIIILGLVLSIGISSLMIQKVELDGSLACNSGDFDISFNITEEIIGDTEILDYSDIIFEGMDGMECSGSYHVKAPAYMLFMLAIFG